MKLSRMHYATSALFLLFQHAFPININVSRGWPCNVFVEHSGAVDSVGNFADFFVKSSPDADTSVRTFVAGESVDYVSSVSKSFNTVISDLPFLEPLGFYLKSKQLGARFGVDVCIPEKNTAREDVVPWTVDVSALGVLAAVGGGDWFNQTRPRVSMSLHATNCQTPVSTAMSQAHPVLPDACEVDGTPLPGSDILSVGATPLQFSFKLMANRQAVVRLSIEETNTGERRSAWDAGRIHVDFTDPPLPNLTVDDLLGKHLFFAPDNDIVQWPGCFGFFSASGFGLSDLKLQGPNNSLDLRWTGKDADCSLPSGCSDGNVRSNNFSSTVEIFLDNGQIATPQSSPLLGVRSFETLYDDLVGSGEDVFPSHARLFFDAQNDNVYRIGNKTMFSATLARLTGPQSWRECRIWFKRDNGFNCALLPEARLRDICTSM